MTDVLDVVRVAVVTPISNSDNFSLSVVTAMAQAVPNMCVRRKVLLKLEGNWNAVCGAMQYLSWHGIWSADNPVEALNYPLSLLVDDQALV